MERNVNRNWEKLRTDLQEQIQRQMDLSRELTDEEVWELIMQEVLSFSSRNYLLLEEKLRIQKYPNDL